MTLETARLLLRPFTTDDAADVHVYASDPAVCRFTDWGPNSTEDTDAWIEVAADAGSPAHWAITLKEDTVGSAGRIPAGTVVGGVGVYGEDRGPLDATPDIRELGWVVRRDLWGRGIATEAVHAVIEALREDDALEQVHARCRPEHKASAKVMAHLGLALDRRVENDIERDGRWMHSDLYVLTLTR
ncbi:GNAT family N-acetyltransferase [Demequina mangrovi]|uniref:Ribosomal-protein-alanine N-acetyltransferase n=1 Tax=Demequina mangrovi TaxID=1043493 RepID=A0A1H6V1Q6_9MICO|nr:GNAT family N-acetyltransferase [Demequina mangrovi]SEI94550.1 ribosomal-protein-alanine N-acetyltransferase [Demequina mangrovi]